MQTFEKRRDGLFRRVVDEFSPQRLVSCAPELGVAELRRMMHDLDVGVVLVESQGVLSGVVVRERLADFMADVTPRAGARASQVMDSSPLTVPSGSDLFAAMVSMLRQDVDLLVVVGSDGRPTGLVSARDLGHSLSLSPLGLRQLIAAADSAKTLAGIREQLVVLVSQARQANVPVAVIAGLIAAFNDAVTRRLANLLAKRDGLVLPAGAAYLALGSQGRGEQTLLTDQDSALVYRDGLAAADLEKLQMFAGKLADGLATAGIPRCPGATMASNPDWCLSLSVWCRRLDEWIIEPRSEHMVQFGMFQDLRVLVGDTELGERLNEEILACVHRHALFFPYMARHIARFAPPLGLFGGIKAERRGEHRGLVNLKKAGIFALTEGVSLLGLEAGIASGTSWEKLEGLKTAGILAQSDREVYAEALNVLVGFRLDLQLQALVSGRKLTNHLAPRLLDVVQRRRLRTALRGVESLQRLLRERYKLNFISR